MENHIRIIDMLRCFAFPRKVKWPIASRLLFDNRSNLCVSHMEEYRPAKLDDGDSLTHGLGKRYNEFNC